MKLEQNSSAAIEIVGGASNGSFSIAMNSKAFRVLSDTLYQDKIGSIVRELSCNAYDSHVMGGTPDVPFEVHLPDAFEPWFSIRDFGIGLSDSDVRNVFTVYFQSTKDQSNDCIGAFGLGAKTPFSYTDQFTVKSVVDSVCTIYSAYITEQGIPNIRVMHTGDTTEKNGVEIKMSVKSEDFRKFADAVSTQLKYFTVKPTVLNGSVFWVETFTGEVFFDSGDIIVKNRTYGNSLTIIQGQVGYPLNLNVLQGKIATETYNILDTLRNFNTAIFFKIGELGVTASREAVEYNELTVGSLERKLQDFKQKVEAAVSVELQTKTSAYDKMLYLSTNELSNSLKIGPTIASKNAVKQFNGQYYYRIGLSSNFTMMYTNIRNDKVTVKGFCRSISPDQMKDQVFMVTDEPKVNTRKIRKLYTKYKDVIAVSMLDGFQGNAKDYLVNYFDGFSNIVLQSEIVLDKVARKPRGTGTPAAKFWDFDIHNSSSLSLKFQKKEHSIDEIEDDFYYVVVKRLEVLNKVHEEMMLKLVHLRQFEDFRIVGIRESDVEKLKNNENAQPVDVLYNEMKEQYKHDPRVRAARKLRFCNSLSFDAKELLKKLHENNINEKYVGIYAKYDQFKDTIRSTNDVSKGNSIIEFLDVPVEDHQTRIHRKFTKVRDAFYEKYPLLNAYNKYGTTNINIDSFVQYAKLVYNCKQVAGN